MLLDNSTRRDSLLNMAWGRKPDVLKYAIDTHMPIYLCSLPVSALTVC